MRWKTARPNTALTSRRIPPPSQPRVSHFFFFLKVLTSRTLDALSGRSLHFKAEIFQRIGAFKFRVMACWVALRMASQARTGATAAATTQ